MVAQLAFDLDSKPEHVELNELEYAERNPKLAASLLKSAEGLQKQIDQKRDPGVSHQNLTARRASIAASMAADADRLEKIQSVMRGMAQAIDDGVLPVSLAGVKARNVIEMLLTWNGFPTSEGEWAKPLKAALIRSGIPGDSEFIAAKEAIEPYVAQAVAVPGWQRELRELERDLIGRKIPGYFPTPPKVVARMLELAELDTDDPLLILEPSAGKGNIADALVEYRDRQHLVDVVEWSPLLRRILELKSHDLVGNDFMEYNGVRPSGVKVEYDRIVMNPPFEKSQDIDHVVHAVEMVKSGGIVVAIMSEGVFFRQGKTEKQFRSWLEGRDHEVEKLPDRAFLESERSTGVTARLVKIVS